MLSFVYALPTVLFLSTTIHNVCINALPGARLRHNDMMASLGLNPDGEPIQRQDDEWWQQTQFVRRQTSNITTKLEDIPNEYVTLPIDHFGREEGTFNNRFWVAESGYKPGGPVFIYDVGEANASSNAIHLQRLRNNTSFFKQIVDHFNGIGIVWEHRFYGNSSPYNISLATPATQFEYLTTEQALADIPTFAWSFKRKNLPNVDLTPAGTPWVMIGGSYPGMRAAFMRRFYPGTIFAAYASSAPVEAANDMSFYFEPIWHGLRNEGWTNCTNDIKAAILEMDNVMANETQSARLKELFLGRGAGNNTNAGFADALSTIFFLWQSYGVDGGAQGLRSFCNWISRDTTTNTTSPAEGFAATKGVYHTISRWASWPSFPATVNENLFTRCEGPNPRRKNASEPLKAPDCKLEERFPEPASISWTWQYCTQWGFLQSANIGEHQLVSKYNSLKHQHDICHRQFPDGRSSDLLPDWPDVEKTNLRFGGWRGRPTNTFWTGGEYDPWRTLSPLSEELQSPKYEITREIPDCAAPYSHRRASDLFGYLVPDAQHAFDFRTTFNASIPARALFTQALEQWLKCWKSSPRSFNGTDGGRRWGGGHFNPAAGSVGALPDVEDEEDWSRERKKLVVSTRTPARSRVARVPKSPRRVRTAKKGLLLAPYP